MVGRPRTMVKRLADVEDRAYQLAVDVGKLCPHQYREWQDGWDADDYGAVWYRAVAAIRVAAHALNYVLGLAEEKAFGEEEAEDRDDARNVMRGEWPAGLDVPESVKARLQSDSPPNDNGSPNACVREAKAGTKDVVEYTRRG